MRSWSARLLLMLVLPCGACEAYDREAFYRQQDASRLAHPAAPPSARDPAGDRSFLVAMRRVHFGLSEEGWRSIGFDRDNLHTMASTPPEQRACKLGSLCMPPVVADGELGRDNAFALLIATVGTYTPLINESDVNSAAEDGSYTNAMRITRLGGDPDPAVSFEWLPVVNGSPEGGDAGGSLRWDGTDRWSINRTAAGGDMGGPPLITGTDAYVVGGRLVGHMPDRAGLGLSSARRSFQLTFSGGLFEMQLTPGLDGATSITLSAWWRLADADIDVRGLGLCPDTGSTSILYSYVMGALSCSADLVGSGRFHPDTPCDSVSLALRAELAPIRLRTEEVLRPVPPPCGADAGTDVPHG